MLILYTPLIVLAFLVSFISCKRSIQILVQMCLGVRIKNPDIKECHFTSFPEPSCSYIQTHIISDIGARWQALSCQRCERWFPLNIIKLYFSHFTKLYDALYTVILWKCCCNCFNYPKFCQLCRWSIIKQQFSYEFLLLIYVNELIINECSKCTFPQCAIYLSFKCNRLF